MKFSAFLLISAAFVPAASQVAAQSIPGIVHDGSTVTLAFNLHNDGQDDPYSENYTTMLSARSSYSFGNSFGATFTLGYQSEMYQDSLFSERYILDVNPTYSFGMGTVGLYYTAISRSRDSVDEPQANYGVTATYESGPFGVEAYAGNYDEDGDFNHNPYGIAASYSLTDDASVYIAHQRDVRDTDNFDAATSIGASYDLGGLTGAPIPVTAAASRLYFDGTSFSDSEWNQFTIAASYDIGGGSKSVFGAFRSWSFYYD